MFEFSVFLVFENDEVENPKKYVRRVGGGLETSLSRNTGRWVSHHSAKLVTGVGDIAFWWQNDCFWPFEFSVKKDPEPCPIRGFMNQPDFRRPRDPLTGREGYSTVGVLQTVRAWSILTEGGRTDPLIPGEVYEARKRQQGLIPGKPVVPLAATTRSDFELGLISKLKSRVWFWPFTISQTIQFWNQTKFIKETKNKRVTLNSTSYNHLSDSMILRLRRFQSRWCWFFINL